MTPGVAQGSLNLVSLFETERFNLTYIRGLCPLYFLYLFWSYVRGKMRASLVGVWTSSITRGIEVLDNNYCYF